MEKEQNEPAPRKEKIQKKKKSKYISISVCRQPPNETSVLYVTLICIFFLTCTFLKNRKTQKDWKGCGY